MTRSFSRPFIGALLASAAGLVALGATTEARADEAGDKVLAAVDVAINKAKTQFFEYDVANFEPGKGEKKLALNVWLKGEKRLTEFLAPADMKGTKVLILSPTQMYVFLPAFGKVRRIASSVSDQGFMGMTFSQDDIALSSYSPTYTATSADAGAQVKLTLTPKSGQTTLWSKIEMLVNKDHNVPAELKYFNAAGSNAKTETRTGYTCEGDVCTPGELKMVDNTKGGAWTKMIRKGWKVNLTIQDDLFTQRSLGG